MRTAIKYETEVSTLFDFVMYYIKIWKISCQDRFREASQPYLDDVYNFFGEIEALAYDLSKSVLIDAHSLQFKGSIIVCSLISVSIELYIRVKLSNEALENSPREPAVLSQLRAANECWDCIVKKLFGQSSVAHIDSFGRYLALRQQKMYRLFRIQKVDEDVKLQNIYKTRITPYYHHAHLDAQDVSTIPLEDPAEVFKFKPLIDAFAPTLEWVKQIQAQKYQHLV